MPDVTVQAGEVSSGKITLVADDVSSVSFDGPVSHVEIYSDGTAEVYYTTDGSTPTIDGKHCHFIPASACVDEIDTGVRDQLQFISAGTPTIRVRRLD